VVGSSVRAVTGARSLGVVAFMPPKSRPGPA
jgi:hypothetical protein